MRNRSSWLSLLAIVVSAVLMAGCNLFNPTPATDWPGRSETLTALAPLPSATTTLLPENGSPEAVSTPTISAPLPPSPTAPPPTAIPQPKPTQAACYQAELVNDVTIPDGTVMSPGKQFVKTWKLWNTGSCDWQPSMLVVFDGGTQLTANLEYQLGKSIPSGKMGEVSLPMTAPLTAGEYTSNWRLKPAGGVAFGVGAGNVPFYVKIKVGDTLFKVSDVAVNVNIASATASCPPGYNFKLSAQITATGPGDVVYRWVFGDSSSQDETIRFSGAGAQSVSASRNLSSTTNETAKIYIVQPNRESFSPGASYSLTCQ